MGWMFARCEEGAALGNEWICHDPCVQRDHAQDPFDAFTHPTHNVSLLDFIGMMKVVEGVEWAEKVPTDLPILNIAGDQTRWASGAQARTRCPTGSLTRGTRWSRTCTRATATRSTTTPT